MRAFDLHWPHTANVNVLNGGRGEAARWATASLARHGWSWDSPWLVVGEMGSAYLSDSQGRDECPVSRRPERPSHSMRYKRGILH